MRKPTSTATAARWEHLTAIDLKTGKFTRRIPFVSAFAAYALGG